MRFKGFCSLAGTCGGIKKVTMPHLWPRQMRAETAAQYCDEVSVRAFKHGIPAIYPPAKLIPGKGERWLIEELDAALNKAHGAEEQRGKRNLSDRV